MVRRETAGALDGWRVLEVADGVAASFCAKVLSDLGAEVVAVEPSGGHPLRSSGPRRTGPPGCPGGRWLYLNTGKSSVTVPAGPQGREQLDALAHECDVLITDDRSWHGKEGLDPGTTVVVITPFGLTGPYADCRATPLITFHSGGEGSLLPSGPGWRLFPDRPPIQIGCEVAEYDAGWNAAAAALAAAYDRLRTGRGVSVDVSVQESQLTLNRTRLSRFTNDRVPLRRDAGRYGSFGMVACRDGWVQLVGMTPAQWDALAASPEAGALADARIATAAARAEHPDLAATAIHAWCRARDKAEVVRVLSALGAPVGAYATPQDLLASAQLSHRGFFRAVDDGAGSQVLLPGPPYRLSATPAGPAPATGTAGGFNGDRATKPALPAGRALDGVRILDFTWAAAGPYATCLLALLGADVVKVESTRRPDPARRGFLADYGGIDKSPNFNEINLNKRSFQVDLSRPEGLALAHRLVDWADVVVDNFRPGVMARFGLDPEHLLARRPDLVVASSSANGSSGPESMAAGLASIFGATGGLSEQTGYADGPPTEIGESTDYRSGNALCVGILAALLHRARTGEGQHVDLASREVVIAGAPDALLAEQLGVPWPMRIGNGHREHAPHGVYPCADDDGWLAVAIVDDTEWAGLCGVLGRRDWVERFPDAAARRTGGAEIDDAVAAWTGTRPVRTGFEMLQAAGVPAMPVMTNEMLATDAHLAARQVFVDLDHPELGRTRVMRQPWLMSDLDVTLRPGPLMGQHTDEILEDVLGLSADEREGLREVLR